MKKRIVACFLIIAMVVAILPANVAQAATYQRGSKGTAVEYLQRNLTFLGFSTNGVDGSYGSDTRKAVIELQKAFGFAATGTVDDTLNEMIKNTVSDIQKYLKYKGYYTGIIDGVSGGGTQNAFKKLQKELKKTQTGFADYFTLKDIVDDTESNVDVKNLREWVARLNGSYGTALESEVYKTYGQEYLDLFYKYPEVLDYFDIYIDYETKQANIVYIDAQEEKEKAIVWEATANGVPILLRYLSGSLGLTEDESDEVIYNTIMTLVMKMYYKDNKLQSVADEIKSAAGTFEGIYSLADASSKKVLVKELMKLHPELTEKTINKIVDTIGEEWGDIAVKLNMTTTVVEYIVAAMELYSISDEFLKQLKQSVQQPSVLYSSLRYLEEVKGQSEEEFLIRYLTSELSIIVIEELLNGATGGIYGSIVGSLRLVSDFFVQATVDEQMNALMMRYYCMNLKDTLMAMREDFVENADLYIESEMNQKIRSYEIAYNFYLCALEVFYESAIDMASKMPWDKTKEVIQADLEFLESYNYDLYVQMCLAEAKKVKEFEKSVTQKMDYMLQQLGVVQGKTVYFTQNKKGCETEKSEWEGNHKCLNCNVSDIITTTWFKEIFGVLNSRNFPTHDRDAYYRDHAGQSCFGFACFAQWYLYADSADENIIGSRVAAVEFNKENIEKYAKPGDVIRVNGHSVLVYSLEEDGIMVIDSNWNTGGQLNCAVQKHKITYGGKYGGHIAYINRVIKDSDVAGKYYGKETTSITSAPTTTPKPTATPKPTVTPKPTAIPTPAPEVTVSRWVKASECPVGATVVDTKWTYTETIRTESTSDLQDGWIKEGERKEVVTNGTFDYATFPDTFSTSHAIYTGMYQNKDAVPVTNGATREILSDVPAGYVYWHYTYPISGDGTAENRIVGYYYNQNLKYVGNWCYATEFSAFKSAKNYTSTANNKEGGGTVYKITDADYMKYDVAKGSYWWYRFEYNTCTYQDVKTFYQYYKTTQKESATEVYEGNGKSNVVKWVKYK